MVRIIEEIRKTKFEIRNTGDYRQSWCVEIITVVMLYCPPLLWIEACPDKVSGGRG